MELAYNLFRKFFWLNAALGHFAALARFNSCKTTKMLEYSRGVSGTDALDALKAVKYCGFAAPAR